MNLPDGRNVEVEGGMVPVDVSWAIALGYCAVAFALLWVMIYVVRNDGLIMVAGIFAAAGFALLYKATRATLDARSFGAMRLRAASTAVGGRFTGSLRISESAAVAGTVRAELRCVRIWFAQGRREQTLWAEERSFPIRRQAGGSYAILEFDVPPDLPASEPPPVALDVERGRKFARWEIQAIAESGGAFRDELYTIAVAEGQAAAAPEDSSLPMELQRPAPPRAVAAPAAGPVTDAGPHEVIRGAAPRARAPKPVETVQNLAEPAILPPPKPDRAAIALLVAANLVPLAGVVFWGWQVGQVVFLYWMENLIIGGFSVLRILAFDPGARKEDQEVSTLPGRLALAGFFCVHYGGFCFVHGLFLASFFGRDASGAQITLLAMVLGMLREPVVVAALLALLVSHGWSFFRNYLGRGEYERIDGQELMLRPYNRIMVTHIYIVFGGFLLSAIRSQLLPMLLFVAVKVGCDIYFHHHEHRGQSAP
jgi:hypothetical protein